MKTKKTPPRSVKRKKLLSFAALLLFSVGTGAALGYTLTNALPSAPSP